MAINFSDNIKINAGKPSDAKYLNSSNAPYANVGEVNSTIVEPQRYEGLTVNINNVEYWYATGTGDGDLVVKSAGGASTNVTGATNGLSVVDGNVELGGTLTGNIGINGSNNNNFTLALNTDAVVSTVLNTRVTNTSNFNINELRIDKDSVGATSINLLTPNDNGFSSIKKDRIAIGVNSGSSSTSSQLTFTPLSMIVEDSLNLKGLVYEVDYSASGLTDPRWIPDNAYVTGLTTAVATTASNGITKTGQDFTLGGTLTENTIIAAGGYSLDFTDLTNSEHSVTGAAAVLDLNAKTNSQLVIKSQSGTLLGDDFTNSIGLNLDYNANLFSITDNRATAAGIQYVADYSLDYTDRSLVDKAYVDAIASGLDAKDASIVATTAADGNIDLTGGTFVSGTTIDGIVVADTWRVLIKNQTDAIENGIYNYSAAASGFTRSEDFDGNPVGEVSQGSFTFIVTGDTLSSTSWLVTTPDPITVGTTEINFTIASKSFDLVEGTGTTVSVVGANRSVSVELATSSGLDFDAAGTAGRLRIASSVGGLGLTLSAGVLGINSAGSGSETFMQIEDNGSNIGLYTGTIANNMASYGGTPAYSAPSIGYDGGQFVIDHGTLSTYMSSYAGSPSNKADAIGYYGGNFVLDLNSTSIGLSSYAGVPTYNSDSIGYSGNGTLTINKDLLACNLATSTTIPTNVSCAIRRTAIGELSIDLDTLTPTLSTIATPTNILSAIGYNSSGQLVLDGDLINGSGGATNITGVTNGLNVSNKLVGLGGTLTGNTIVDTGDYGVAFGTLMAIGGTNSFAIGCENQTNGASSFASGTRTYAYGSESHAGGYGYSGYNIYAKGTASFNHSFNTNSATQGDGANALQSAILGGRNHNIEVGNIRSAIIGGDSINLTGTSYIDTTAVSNLAIMTTPSAGGVNDVLTLDSLGKVTKVTQASIASQAAATTASNGLTKTGNDIQLGGTLTSNIEIGTANAYGVRMGYSNTAGGRNSLAIGAYTTAAGYNSFVGGCGYNGGAVCGGENSIAFGYAYGTIKNNPNGAGSLAMGNAGYNDALIYSRGSGSIAFGAAYQGSCIVAHTTGAFAMGSATYNTLGGSICAEGSGSFAMGYAGGAKICAKGANSFAMGNTTYDDGVNDNTYAGGTSSFAFGRAVCSTEDFSVTFGNNNKNTVPTGFVFGYNNNLGSTNSCATILGTGIKATGGTNYQKFLLINSLAIMDAPAVGTTSDSVLVRNSSTGIVKTVAGSELGDANNIYDVTGITTATLTGSEYVVLVQTSGATQIVTLPAAPVDGQAFKIKDKGNALTNSITVAGNGNNIDGAASATINTDYGALELVYSSSDTEWYSLAFIN